MSDPKDTDPDVHLICKCGERFTDWTAAHKHFTDATGTVGLHCLQHTGKEAAA